LMISAVDLGTVRLVFFTITCGSFAWMSEIQWKHS
jgi:hypothetical protein